MKKSVIPIFLSLSFCFTISFILPTIISLNQSCNPKTSINLSDYKKIYINDSLNSTIPTITNCHLSFLSNGIFSGNVYASYNQTIQIGSYPLFTDNPKFALKISSIQSNGSMGNFTYSTIVTFDKIVNFTHSSSKREDLSLFGKKYFISSDTTTRYPNNKIVLLEGEKFLLDSKNKASIYFNNQSYTLELISVSDNSAVIKVMDSYGNGDIKKISEDNLENIDNLFFDLIASGYEAPKSIALVIVATDIITLKDGHPVLVGKEEKVINGTRVYFGNGDPGGLTSLAISVYAENSDKESINLGQSVLDPFYKSFRLSFIDTNKYNNKTYANILFEEIIQNCTPQWILEEAWSICENDFQYRDWIDMNNCNNQSTKPNEINRSCEFINGNLTEKIDELEERIILLEHWKSSVSEWIDEVVVTLEEIFTFKNEVEEKLSTNQALDYFNYLSNSERKNVLCGYAQDNHLTNISDLGILCNIKYTVLRNGKERGTCKCTEIE